MQIDSSVAEADVGGVVEGQGVDFTVDAYPYRTFHGAVTQVRNSPTDGQQRRHLRLRHRRDQCGLQIETRHDGERFHHHRPTRKCVDHSQCRAAIPSAGQRRGADQLGCGANCAGDQRRQFCRRVRRAGPSAAATRAANVRFSTRFMCFRATGKDAKLQAVQIKTGISDGISTEVLSGLDEGDAGCDRRGFNRHAAPASDLEPVWRRLPPVLNALIRICRADQSRHQARRKSTRCITPAKWMSTPCAAFRWKFSRANSWPSWVRAAPAKAR